MVHRPLRLILDSDALAANWRALRDLGGDAACGAAVKADGYGLGAREVVGHLAKAGCRDFFVSTWAEADALGPLGDGLALSVLHGPGPDDGRAARGSAARPVLNSPAQVARWREMSEGRPCDVMVDTGMNRLGLTPEQATSGLLDGLLIDTLMSHLACADTPASPMNRRQLDAFRAVAAKVPARRASLANSAGILLGRDYAFDLTRPGLALYGGHPSENHTPPGLIRPVVRIEAQIVQVRDVPAGQTIGYGADFKASRDQRVAIVNAGYADGYLRLLGLGGSLWLGEIPLPILGRISMDLIAVGVWDALAIGEGDWIRLPFDVPAMPGPLSQYEWLTGLGTRFERIWR